MSDEEIVLTAPAKINLWLRVHGKRADGYHELSTVMLALDLCDELRGRRTHGDGIVLEVNGPQASGDINAGPDNLVWRALAAVRELARSRGRTDLPGMHVTLTKNIPSQAGLGGGSSDAASALRLGEHLLELDGGDAWRRTALAELGADCSFFHELGSSRVARCDGVGERVEPWPGAVPEWHVVLVVPELVCPTGAIFAALNLHKRSAAEAAWTPADLALPVTLVRQKLATDLQSAALRAVPALAAWRALFDGLGQGHFMLSGSGSAFFGLFAEAESARAALEEIRCAAAQSGLALRASCVTVPMRAKHPWELDHES